MNGPGPMRAAVPARERRPRQGCAGLRPGRGRGPETFAGIFATVPPTGKCAPSREHPPALQMELLPIVKALALVATANSAPVVAKMILGARLATPLDGGAVLRDGRPLFGPTKTIRGIAAALVATVAVAPVLAVDWTLALLAGASAMVGDLVSSFAKRRLGYAASSSAPGLDHIPESLIPLIAVGAGLGLGAIDIILATAAFWIGAAALSPLLFRIGLRDRPH